MQGKSGVQSEPNAQSEPNVHSELDVQGESDVQGRPASVVRFTATPVGAERFASLLARLVEHVNDELGTTTWMAVRSEDDPQSFFLVDVFSDRDARRVHFEGAAAALLRSEAPGLLKEQPEIWTLELLAGKNV